MHKGQAFGIKRVAVPLATVIGGLAVPAVAVTTGWQWAFVIAGLGVLATSSLIPGSQTSPADRRRDRIAKPVPSVAQWPLIVLAIGFGLGLCGAAGLSGFLVTSTVAMGFAKGTAGLIAALAGNAVVGARVAGNIRADRRGRAHFPVVASMLAAGALGYGSRAASSTTHTRWLFIVGAVVDLGAGWGWNGLCNFPVVRTHIDSPACAFGVVRVGGRLGGMLGPVVVGIVVGHWSFPAAWLLAVGMSLRSECLSSERTQSSSATAL